MNPAFLKSMKAKKKRAVDPNAPPRPNLLTHDVKIRDQQSVIDSMTREVHTLRDTIRRLESKINLHSNYLQALHSKFKNK